MTHHYDHAKHLEHKRHDHHAKAGSWTKGGKPCQHRPGFFKDHLAGTFHHDATDSVLSLPSEHIAVLKILP